jgi:hypothetical protein
VTLTASACLLFYNGIYRVIWIVSIGIVYSYIVAINGFIRGQNGNICKSFKGFLKTGTFLTPEYHWG